MKTLLLVTLALMIMGCETGKSGGEISAIGESLIVQPAEVVDDSYHPTEPLIDSDPRAALNYAGAVNACVAASRHLCTKDELDDAARTGDVYYTFGNTRQYWMVQTTIAPSNANKNVFQGNSTYGVSYLYYTPSDHAFEFYCCKN